MKILLKPEIEFVELEANDIVTSSFDTVTLENGNISKTESNAHDSTEFSSGEESLWNLPLQ